MDQIVRLAQRVAEVERRLAGMIRHGRVHSVDAAAGMIRLRIGGTDSKPFLSPPVPYAQIAGALKAHTPPSVGQQMTLICPDGNVRMGVALPMTWSDANTSPSSSGEENVVTFGGVRIELRDDELVISGPKVRIDADIETNGSTLKHNGKEIGSTHRHGGVIPGGGQSDVPV